VVQDVLLDNIKNLAVMYLSSEKALSYYSQFEKSSHFPTVREKIEALSLIAEQLEKAVENLFDAYEYLELYEKIEKLDEGN